MCALRATGERLNVVLLAGLLSCALLMGVASPVSGQGVPSASDSGHGMLRDDVLGLLHDQAELRETRARERCLLLPVDPPNDRLQGPHGDSLVANSCEVARFQSLGSGTARAWFSAEYRWVLLFTAEDSAGGPAARDTVTESEVVLFAASDGDLVRPIWHARIETGDRGVWRSVTPELASRGSNVLLSVQHCVNGTGGCSQEFLSRSTAGRWSAVWQRWMDQLPHGLAGRILHGVRIDVRTLEGEAGFYGSHDPNCCPSETLRIVLALQGDSLVLSHYEVLPAESTTHR
jgi:hypothetical protein